VLHYCYLAWNVCSQSKSPDGGMVSSLIIFYIYYKIFELLYWCFPKSCVFFEERKSNKLQFLFSLPKPLVRENQQCFAQLQLHWAGFDGVWSTSETSITNSNRRTNM